MILKVKQSWGCCQGTIRLIIDNSEINTLQQKEKKILGNRHITDILPKNYVKKIHDVSVLR